MIDCAIKDFYIEIPAKNLIKENLNLGSIVSVNISGEESVAGVVYSLTKRFLRGK